MKKELLKVVILININEKDRLEYNLDHSFGEYDIPFVGMDKKRFLKWVLSEALWRVEKEEKEDGQQI